MISKSSKIIRKLAGTSAFVFNDKLIDGRRSYKVWGWGISDYENAKTQLEQEGYEVSIRFYKGYSSRGLVHYTQPRLYVA